MQITEKRRSLLRMRDALILAGLAAVVVLAFWQVAVSGRVFFFRDFATYFYPKRVLAAEAMRSLRVPYWQSYSGCGEPFLGTLQQAVFYPPALIYYLLPMPQSFMWFVIFHLFLSGAGAYFMMRVWGVRRGGSALTAFAWAFSPAFVSTIDNVSFMTSLAWLPWCLAFTRRIYGGQGFRGFTWLTVSFAMAILAGGPEPVIFIGATVAVYAACRTVGFIFKGEARTALRTAGAAIGGIAAGVLLAGVQVAPFVYTLQYSARQQPQTFREAGLWSARLSDAVLWVLPRFYAAAGRGGVYMRSQHWLKSVYLGVAVPFLAVWTLTVVRRRRNFFFAVVAVSGITLSLGMHSVVWRFLHGHLPGFALIRFPVKFYLPAAFAMAVLAGFAADDLRALARLRRGGRARALVAVMLVSAFVFGACYGAMRIWQKEIFTRVTPPEMVTHEEGAEEAAERYLSTQWSFGRSAALLAATGAGLSIVAYLSRTGIRRPYGALIVVAALLADAGLFGAQLNPVAGAHVYTEAPANLALVPHEDPDHRLYMTPQLQEQLELANLAQFDDLETLVNYVGLVKGLSFETAEELLGWLERTSGFQFSSTGEADAWLQTGESSEFLAAFEQEIAQETFCANLNLLYKVSTPDAFEPMTIARHHTLLARMIGNAVHESRSRDLPILWGSSMAVVTRSTSPGFAYARVEPEGSRARLVERVTAAATDSEAETLIALTDLPILDRVVLSAEDAAAALAHLGGGAGPGVEEQPPLGAAHVVYDDGNTVRVEVEAARPALLFLSDNWFPAFEATVDGEIVPIWRANYAYRAVPVGAGKHTVEFSYRPYDFHVGLAMTGAAVIILLAGRLSARHRR